MIQIRRIVGLAEIFKDKITYVTLPMEALRLHWEDQTKKGNRNDQCALTESNRTWKNPASYTK